MSHGYRPSQIASSIVLGSVCVFSLGCGSDGTYDVSGTVTFAGKPIPEGEIYFIPDGEKGNSGPTGYAKIKEGKFDTSDGGRGAPAGPVIVTIEGLDPNAAPKEPEERPKGGGEYNEENSEEATLRSLFPTYQTKIELPAEDSEQTFDVPAEAADVKPDQGPVFINP